MVADLADVDTAGAVFDAAVERWGYCDLLVNNAAWSLHRPFLDVTPAEFDRLIAINQRAPFLLTQRFAELAASGRPACHQHLQRQRGERQPQPRRVRRDEGRPGGDDQGHGGRDSPAVRVNAIRPGSIDTAALHDAIANGQVDPDEHWRDYPIPQATQPADLAAILMVLLSPAARTITGATWTVDGGYTAH